MTRAHLQHQTESCGRGRAAMLYRMPRARLHYARAFFHHGGKCTTEATMYQVSFHEAISTSPRKKQSRLAQETPRAARRVIVATLSSSWAMSSGQVFLFNSPGTRHVCCSYCRAVDVTKLREDLLLRLERERSEEVAGLRAKQKQVGRQRSARVPILTPTLRVSYREPRTTCAF